MISSGLPTPHPPPMTVTAAKSTSPRTLTGRRIVRSSPFIIIMIDSCHSCLRRLRLPPLTSPRPPHRYPFLGTFQRLTPVM